jgi:hypothetical protein
MIYAGAMSAAAPAATPAAACSTGEYRVVARHWDTELKQAWELRQDCAHPQWPAHSVAIASTSADLYAHSAAPILPVAIPELEPLLVRAGEPVRLWSQDANVRIEITGVAEQSARRGERINIRIARQSIDSGLNVQHIAGIVRGAGQVEMDR